MPDTEPLPLSDQEQVHLTSDVLQRTVHLLTPKTEEGMAKSSQNAY